MKTVLMFTGAQNTGKTTTLHALSKSIEPLGCDYMVVSGGSRFLKDIGMLEQVDLKASAIEQMLINAELLLKYYETVPSDIPLILSERTPICVYSYARNIKGVPDYVLKFNERFLKTTLERKDLNIIVLYFPILDAIKFREDGVRLKSSQKIIDNTIRQVLKEYNIQYYTMKTADLNERIELIKRIIKKEATC